MEFRQWNWADAVGTVVDFGGESEGWEGRDEQESVRVVKTRKNARCMAMLGEE